MEITGSSRPLIRACQIHGSSSGGVIIEERAQPRFDGNHFMNNHPVHIQNGSVYRVNARNNAWRPTASRRTVLGKVNY